MPGLLPNVDPDGLLEYSVVYTDRAVNHMSASFQTVMTDISATLKEVYHADAVAIVPGSGTFGMEAVARQLATDKNVLVLRNGLFSFRWSQIFAAGSIPSSETVLKARRAEPGLTTPFTPAPIDEVTATIAEQRPDIVFAPHVETSAGMLLPDAYIAAVAAATHEVGGLFVLDCIASGAAVGEHGTARGRRVGERPAEGLERIAVLWAGDAQRRWPGGGGSVGEHEFRLRSGQVAPDHGGVRGGRSRLPRHDAHRRFDGLPQRDGRDC